MNKNKEPWNLAANIMLRSVCRVKVGAVIVDCQGYILAWGWNHSGPNGRGQCAEQHALSRANPKRLKESIIYVQGWNGVNPSVSIPCTSCYKALKFSGVIMVHCRGHNKKEALYHIDELCPSLKKS